MPGTLTVRAQDVNVSHLKTSAILASLLLIVAACGVPAATQLTSSEPGTQPSGTQPSSTQPVGTPPGSEGEPSGRAVDGPIDDGSAGPSAPSFIVGGTVSGLTGDRDASSARLVLEDHHGLFFEVFDNGPFEFPTLGDNPAGSEYLVKVFNQPRLPSQVCTVTNGTGTLTDHDVTDITVECVPP